MDISSLLLLVLISCSALFIFLLREELGITFVLLLGIYSVPLQKLILSDTYYLFDSLLNFLLYTFMVIVILYKTRIDKTSEVVKTPLKLPILLFLVSILITGVFSLILFSQTLGLVFMGLMDMIHYLMFFPVIYCIKTEKQLHSIILFIFIVAIINAIFTIISSFYPDSPFAFANVVEKWGFGGYYFRTFPYGLHLIVLIFLISISILPFLQSGFIKILLLGIILTLFFSVILTFTRSIWLPLIISLVGLVVLIPRKNMGKLIIWISICCVIVVIASMFLNYISPSFYYGDLIHTVSKGFISSFKAFDFIGGLSLDPSFNARILEAQQGIEMIKDNLLVGVGYKYRLATEEARVSYLHNGYLSILMVQGLIGFIPFMWLIIAFFVRILKIYRSFTVSAYKGMVLGFIAGYWFILMYAFLGNGLQHGKEMILVLMLIMGLTEVIHRLKNTNEK